MSITAPGSDIRDRWTAALTRPVDAASLAVFRIVFGLVVLWETYRYFTNGWIDRYFVDPPVRFAYFGFEWLPRLPPGGFVLLFVIIGLAGAGIALGAYYRICAAVFTVGFAYVFLIEQTRYLNHFYLMVLLGALLTVVPAHRLWSLDAWADQRLRADVVPAWGLRLLQVQIAIVYVYGAIAKLNPDWLAGEPMRGWLAAHTDFPLIGSTFDHPWAAYVGSWGGLLFDLLIVPAVLWRRTRVLALVAAAGFHLINNQLFSIGVFPVLGFAALLLFCAPDWPRRLLGLLSGVRPEPASPPGPSPRLRPVATVLLVGFVAIQLLVPLRHLLYPGVSNWTEYGHQFSWHMKLRQKTGDAVLLLADRGGEQYREVSVHDLLPRWQADKVVIQPELLRQLSHHVADAEARAGRPGVQVRVVGSVALNGREPQPLVDPAVDLAAEPRRITGQPWVLPLR